MENKNMIEIDVFTESLICPRCNRRYSNYPALSRVDNKTNICPACGEDEAMIEFVILNGGAIDDKLNKIDELISKCDDGLIKKHLIKIRKYIR